MTTIRTQEKLQEIDDCSASIKGLNDIIDLLTMTVTSFKELVDQKFDKIEKALTSISEQNRDLKAQFEKQETKIKELKEENDILICKMKQLESRAQRDELRNRAHNIRLVGFPEESAEDILQTVVNIIAKRKLLHMNKTAIRE